MRALYRAADCWFLLVFSNGKEQRGEARCLMTLTRELIPFMKAPPSWPRLILIISQRPYLLISLHCGAGFQFMNWGGRWEHTNIQAVTTHLKNNLFKAEKRVEQITCHHQMQCRGSKIWIRIQEGLVFYLWAMYCWPIHLIWVRLNFIIC